MVIDMPVIKSTWKRIIWRNFTSFLLLLRKSRILRLIRSRILRKPAEFVNENAALTETSQNATLAKRMPFILNLVFSDDSSSRQTVNPLDSRTLLSTIKIYAKNVTFTITEARQWKVLFRPLMICQPKSDIDVINARKAKKKLAAIIKLALSITKNTSFTVAKRNGLSLLRLWCTW